MRIDALLRLMGIGLVAASGIMGCAAGDADSEEPAPGAPEFPEGTGQDAPNAAAYPAGPYGIKVGSVIANYQFVGFINAAADKNGMQQIQLSDFYNPTGTETFPADSRFGGGQPKPKALLVDVASVWCGPCNDEARYVLPGLHAKYKPMGGEFLLQLADGPTPGDAAEPGDLDRWTRRYDVDYPSAIDPTYKLGALFDADAYPANMIIRTKDMTVVHVLAGAPVEGSREGDLFWSKFEQVLNEPN